MEKYFLKGVNENYGPYSVEELKSMQITKQTLVQVESSETWVEAQDIEPIAALFSTDSITEGVHWGPFSPGDCTGQGLRQYSAILWDIPWGQNWEDACWAAPATINGIYFPRPNRCVNNTNQWGEFDVPDTSCGIVPPPHPTEM